MSSIVIKNCPITMDFRLATIVDLEGAGNPQMALIDVSATCSFSMESGSLLGTVLGALPEEEAKEHDMLKMTLRLFAQGLQDAILERQHDVILTKDLFASEAAVWEKHVEEFGNSRYAQQYQCSISDVHIDTISCWDKDETAVIYEWKAAPVAQAAPAAQGSWVCGYCGSTVSGNFCCHCGAARE